MTKKNKYNVSPPEDRRYNGRTYASKAEMRYAMLLYQLRDNGDIIDFVEQPRLWLGVPENKYVPDFLVIPESSISVYPHYVDVKGFYTPAFKRVVKLWKAYGILDLVVIKPTKTSFKTAEVIDGAIYRQSS